MYKILQGALILTNTYINLTKYFALISIGKIFSIPSHYQILSLTRKIYCYWPEWSPGNQGKETFFASVAPVLSCSTKILSNLFSLGQSPIFFRAGDAFPTFLWAFALLFPSFFFFHFLKIISVSFLGFGSVRTLSSLS